MLLDHLDPPGGERRADPAGDARPMRRPRLAGLGPAVERWAEADANIAAEPGSFLLLPDQEGRARAGC